MEGRVRDSERLVYTTCTVQEGVDEEEVQGRPYQLGLSTCDRP